MRNRIAVRLLPLLLLCAALLAPSAARADGTPTPQRPFRVYLPVIMKDLAPAEPMTVAFQQGAGGYSGETDTYISSYGDPYAPHGFEPIMAVRWQRSQVSDAEAGLIRFDVSSIPPTATIKSATLTMYVTGRTNANPISLAAFGVLRPWRPDQANWISATQSSAWAVVGCNGVNIDRMGQATDNTDTSVTGVWINLSLTALVQQWVRDPASNFGAAIKPTGTSSTPSVRYELAAALHPDPGLHPRLTVTYILLPAPVPTVAPPTATATATPTPTSSVPSPTTTASPTPTATWTPSASWWNTGYTYRRRLTVLTAAGYGVAAGYAVSLTLNTDQLIADGRMRADRRDWRIVAWNGLLWEELDRHVVGPAETWFSLVRPIAANSRDDLYYVYYGNPAESGDALADKNYIYAFYDDFDAYDGSKWPWPAPSGIQVGGGVITVTAFNPDGGAADSCPGAYDCMLSRQTFAVGYQVEHRARHPDYVYLKMHDADQGFSDDGHTHEVKLRSYNTGMFQRVNRDGTTNVVAQCCKPADTAWHTFRITRLDNSTILFQVDDSPVETSTTHLPLMALPVHIRAYSNEPLEASRNVVDWIKVRPVVAEEPIVAWGREEQAQFSAPAHVE